MKAYRYVITTDSGAAPNFGAPATTLVVCKPDIRKKAKRGDLVMAFNGKTLSPKPHSVRWAGVVSDVIPMEDYWHNPRFLAKRPGHSERPDNLYSLVDGAWRQEPNPTHPGEAYLPTDIRGRNALVFDRSWYFGDTAPELPEEFGLRVLARRCVLNRVVASEEWPEIEAWLDAQEDVRPDNLRPGRGCRPVSSRRC